MFGGSNSDNPSIVTDLQIAGVLQVEGTVSFFGVTPVAQQPGGPQSAGAKYGATEQDMLQTVYDTLRIFGLLS